MGVSHRYNGADVHRRYNTHEGILDGKIFILDLQRELNQFQHERYVHVEYNCRKETSPLRCHNPSEQALIGQQKFWGSKEGAP